MSEKNIMREHFFERYNTSKNCMLDPPLPESLNLEINNTCNQKCIICPHHGPCAINKLSVGVMDVCFAKRILKQASELGIGRKELGLYMAGEPFMHPYLAEIISFAKTLSFPYVYITTNGVMADTESIKRVVDAGLDSIRFSVNAPNAALYKEMHGVDGFETVLENIKFLDDYRKENDISIVVSMSCVLTDYAIKTNISEKMKTLFGRYVDDIVFIPFLYRGLKYSEELQKKYGGGVNNLEIDKDFCCPVPFNSMYIDCHGHVIPCCEGYGLGGIIADLNDDLDLKGAWSSNNYLPYRRLFSQNGPDKGLICEKCFTRIKNLRGFS